MLRTTWTGAGLVVRIVMAGMIPLPSGAQVQTRGAIPQIVNSPDLRLPAQARPSSVPSLYLSNVGRPFGSTVVPTRAWPGAVDAAVDSGRTSTSRRGSHAKVGALVGGGFGLGVGLLASAVGSALDDGGDGPSALRVTAGVIAVTGIFALIGAGIGWLFP